MLTQNNGHPVHKLSAYVGFKKDFAQWGKVLVRLQCWWHRVLRRIPFIVQNFYELYSGKYLYMNSSGR